MGLEDALRKIADERRNPEAEEKALKRKQAIEAAGKIYKELKPEDYAKKIRSALGWNNWTDVSVNPPYVWTEENLRLLSTRFKFPSVMGAAVVSNDRAQTIFLGFSGPGLSHLGTYWIHEYRPLEINRIIGEVNWEKPYPDVDEIAERTVNRARQKIQEAPHITLTEAVLYDYYNDPNGKITLVNIFEGLTEEVLKSGATISNPNDRPKPQSHYVPNVPRFTGM
jgi:hypothetical protein